MSGAAAAERGGRPGLVADLFVSQEERISQFNYLLFFETLSRYEGGREEGGAPCRVCVSGPGLCFCVKSSHSRERDF